MRIVVPKNIFSAVFGLSLPDNLKDKIDSENSAMIAKRLSNRDDEIGFIPSLDLINYENFLVSSKFAISFDGDLSNSYLYFKEEDREINEVLLRGDVSSNEILLSKIWFKEKFGDTPEFKLDTKEADFTVNNYIICGDENFTCGYYKSGISFSDQIADFLDFPYVNFILVSKNEELLKEFHDAVVDPVNKIEDNIGSYLSKMDYQKKINEFVKDEIGSVYYDLTGNEKEALHELLRLPFFHNITKDLVDIKFI